MMIQKILFFITLAVCRAGVIVPEDDVDGRIFNGRDATLGQFKYTVLLMITKGGTTGKCGGSLISQNFVLTAGHCTWGSTYVMMYFGIIDTNKAGSAVQSRAASVHIHPGFNNNTLANDISLLRTDKNIQMSNYIGTIALPSHSQSSITQFDNVYATASGWGRRFNDEVGGHNILQWTNVHVAPQATCQAQLRTYPFSSNMNICSDKSTNSTPCKGDSGGPLAYYRNGANPNPILIGAVSWGTGACYNPLPNAYTRIGNYLNYIQGITGIKINN